MNKQSADRTMKPETLFYIGLTISLACLAVGYWIAL